MKTATNNNPMLTYESLISVFGCTNFEQEILTVINKALANGRMPDFSGYNDPRLSKCECRTGKCSWTEESIIARLKEKGVWKKLESLYSAGNVPAHFTPEGTISVLDANFPYVGEFDNYREMDAAAAFWLSRYPKGFVARVLHNKPEEYVLMLPEGSKYITIDD